MSDDSRSRSTASVSPSAHVDATVQASKPDRVLMDRRPDALFSDVRGAAEAGLVQLGFLHPDDADSRSHSRQNSAKQAAGGMYTAARTESGPDLACIAHARPVSPDLCSLSDIIENASPAPHTLDIHACLGAADDITTICRKFGAVHAVTEKAQAGAQAQGKASQSQVLVTFEDTRALQRAGTALSHLPEVLRVSETFVDTPPHNVSGLVLAVKQADEEDDTMVVDNMKSMLSIFGGVVSGHRVPTTTAGVTLALFDFFSIRDAAQAVEAIGNRSGSFSLHLVNRDGTLARAINRTTSDKATVSLHAGSATDESSPVVSSQPSQPSSSSDPAAVSSAAYMTIDAPQSSDSQQNHAPHLPVFSSHNASDVSRVAFLAAAQLQSQAAHTSAAHAHGAPLSMPNPTPGGPPHALPVAPAAALPHEWSGQQHVHVLPSMPTPGLAGLGRRTADFLTTFDPNEAAAGGVRARTTVMIRNIPCRWTADDLLSVLAHVIDGTWDLLYMPCKNTAVANAGYAFMNFCTSQDTLRLYNAMHGHQWPHTRSGKICEIRYARIQGRQLLTHLNSGDPSGAAAFRGYLAYPSGGSIVIHGPNNMQPPLAPHPAMAMHVPMHGGPTGMEPGHFGGLPSMPQHLPYVSNLQNFASISNIAPSNPRAPAAGGGAGMPAYTTAHGPLASVPMQPVEGVGIGGPAGSHSPEVGGVDQPQQYALDSGAGGWPGVHAASVGLPAGGAQYAAIQGGMGPACGSQNRGADANGSNAFQLQSMLQSLMKSMPH